MHFMHALHAVSNSRARRGYPIPDLVSVPDLYLIAPSKILCHQCSTRETAPDRPNSARVWLPGRSYMVVDSTVVEPALRAAIEQQAGFALKDADPDALRFVVQRSKEAGNQAYKNRDYNGKTSHMVPVYAALGSGLKPASKTRSVC